VDEWITTKEAAKILKVTQGYVARLARRSEVKAKKVGRNWLISGGLIDTVMSGIHSRGFRPFFRRVVSEVQAARDPRLCDK